MPILKSKHIEFEFTPKKFVDNELLFIEVNFLIGGQPVLSKVITEDTDDPDKRPGSLIVSEDIYDDKDTSEFVLVLDNVLKNNKPSTLWNPDFPLIIEVHPNARFPLLYDYEKIIEKKEGFLTIAQAKDDDPVTLIIQVDPNFLIHIGESWEEGFSFIITVTRKKLKTFLNKLKQEVKYVKNKCRYKWSTDEENDTSELIPENINNLRVISFKGG